MTFELTSTKVIRLVIAPALEDASQCQSGEGQSSTDTEMTLDNGFHPEDTRKFMVRFRLCLMIHHPTKMRMEIQFIAEFRADTPLTEEDKTSHYVTRNAPAIAYPFLRSYIAQVVLLSGYGSLFLPPVNFATFTIKQKPEGGQNELVLVPGLRDDVPARD